MRVSKQEQLEIELKGLQHELLEKEELLRTSVSMEDMKKVQNENEKMNSIKKSLDQKIHDLEESLEKAEDNAKNQEEKYHKNIQSIEKDLQIQTSKYQGEIQNLRYEISQNSQVQNLSSEIEIEKEKARAAIEMARLEIKAAEDKFRSLLSEKDEEISKARSIAQTNEDEQDRSMGSLRALNLELTQANKELNQRIDRIDDEYKIEISRNNELVESFKIQADKMRTQCEEKDKEIFKLSDTVRKQIEERIELSSTIEQLKNPDDNEVIMLPITSRLKAASLPPIDHSKYPLKTKKAWGSRPTSDVTSVIAEEDDPRKSTSAPVIKSNRQKKNTPNLNMTSIRKRLNLALNRS